MLICTVYIVSKGIIYVFFKKINKNGSRIIKGIKYIILESSRILLFS